MVKTYSEKSPLSIFLGGVIHVRANLVTDRNFDFRISSLCWDECVWFTTGVFIHTWWFYCARKWSLFGYLAGTGLLSKDFNSILIICANAFTLFPFQVYEWVNRPTFHVSPCKIAPTFWIHRLLNQPQLRNTRSMIRINKLSDYSL